MESQEFTLSLLSPYENFIYALNAKETKRQYLHNLEQFLSFIGFQGTIEEKSGKLFDLGKDINLLQSYLIRYINFQKRRIVNKEISDATLRNHLKPIKLFFSMNDVVVNWKKISKGILPGGNHSDDRIPTMEEIKKLLEFPDRRIKVIVLVMLSSGIRVGSWDHLKWKHVIPLLRNNNVVAVKLIVKNAKINGGEYYSLITPEAYFALKDYIDFRKLHGEEITGESWLIRDTWQKLDRNHGHRIGLAKFPKKVNSTSIRNMIYDAWKIQGVRIKLSNPQNKRHEFKSTHGFRKFFETKCQYAKMNHNNIKLLMDHSLWESQNYHRPTEEELLEDYLNVIDLLTVNEENRLKRKVETLQVEKSKIDYLTIEIEKMKKKWRNK
jgi:hypothetical protein